MKKTSITFSDAAIADILEQSGWYEAQADRNLAQRWHEAVTATLLRIARRPGTGSPCLYIGKYIKYYFKCRRADMFFSKRKPGAFTPTSHWTLAELKLEEKVGETSASHFVEAMTVHFGRELFCHKHPSAPTIPNIIESGKAWSGTLPKFPLPNPST